LVGISRARLRVIDIRSDVITDLASLVLTMRTLWLDIFKIAYVRALGIIRAYGINVSGAL
jgi:hypothetical protein